MTSLTIIQNAVNRIKTTTPNAIFSGTDDQIILLRSLMNQEGIELSKGGPTDHAWTVLVTEKTFTTVAAAIQTSAVPSDFRWYIDDSMWNRSTVMQITGPLTPEEWQDLQANTAGIVYPMFRFQGGNIKLYPTPTAGQTVAYEYVSKNWAQTSASVGLSAMTADTDTALLEEELISQGIVWRFKASKGLDYAEDFRTYQLSVAKAISRDGGRRIHRLGGGFQRRYHSNVPEGSWNQ